MKSDTRNDRQVNRLILHYTDDEVARIKTAAEKNANTWISTNEAMLVHIWRIMLNAADLINDRELLGAAIPVNVREKVDGASRRVAGNCFVTATLRCDMSDKNKSTEQQVHDGMRAMLTKEKVSNLNRLSNYIWSNSSFDWHEDAVVGDASLGDIRGFIGWNNQASSPFFDVDFGAGPPLRGALWNWDQPVTVS